MTCEISAIAADSLRPPRKSNPADWAKEHRRLVAQAGASRAGRWDESMAPYVRGPLEAFADPHCKRIILVWGSQSGKTDGVILNALLWSICERPGPAMFVLPSDDTLEEFVSMRLKHTVLGNPEVRRRLIGETNRHFSSKGAQFLGSNLYFASAGSPAALASKPVRYLFLDEIDKQPKGTGNEGRWLELAIQRTKTFWDRKILMASTPTVERGPIWMEWLSSARHEWWVPCLGCGETAPYELENLKTAEPRPREISSAAWANRVREGRVKVTYHCGFCGRDHGEGDKALMNARGSWVCLDGEEGKESEVRGYRLNSLASQLMPWREVLGAFLAAKDDAAQLRAFKNGEMGEPWAERGARLDEDAAVGARRLATPRGVVPTGAAGLTTGWDVQHDRVVWVVWAWWATGRGHLVDHGIALDLDEAARQTSGRRYPVEGSSAEMSLAGGFVDSGDQTAKVYRWTLRSKAVARMWPCKGFSQGQRGGAAKGRLYSTEVSTPEGDRVSLWHVDVSQYKRMVLLDSLGAEVGDPEGLTFHEETDADFARQLGSEELVEEVDRHGYPRSVWQRRPGYAHNHFLDATVYARAMADRCRFSLAAPARRRIKYQVLR